MITHQEIVDYMQAMLAKAHESYDYAALSIEISQYRRVPAKVSFALYTDKNTGNIQGASFEECLEKRGDETPEVTAAKLRAQAAELLADADKLSPQAL